MRWSGHIESSSCQAGSRYLQLQEHCILQEPAKPGTLWRRHSRPLLMKIHCVQVQQNVVSNKHFCSLYLWYIFAYSNQASHCPSTILLLEQWGLWWMILSLCHFWDTVFYSVVANVSYVLTSSGFYIQTHESLYQGVFALQENELLIEDHFILVFYKQQFQWANTVSRNHRTIECSELEKTHKDHQVPGSLILWRTGPRITHMPEGTVQILCISKRFSTAASCAGVWQFILMWLSDKGACA